jgi:hypothetical protein
VATSGTSNFDPTFDDILQDAAGMVGGGPLLAEELIAAKRGLDYLMTDIQNRNVLLHKIETTAVIASVSVSSVSLDNTVLDVLSASARTSTTGSANIVLMRHGFERWAEIPTKTQTGRVTSYWFDRRRAGNEMYLWPLPSTEQTLILTIQKTVEDTIRAFDNIDVPRRFLPAVVFGLAYWIGLRRSARVPAERLQMLKMEYEAALRGAMREDRERGSIFVRVGR